MLAVLSLNLLACSGKPLQLRSVAKTDIDMVVDMHWRTIDQSLIVLMGKLYERNPDELYKTPNATILSRQQQLWATPLNQQTAYLGKDELSTMDVALDVRFQGDRVYAVMAGLRGMLSRSYGYIDDFYLFDTPDQQALYNSARNVEILVWRLKHRLDSSGTRLLFTNGFDKPPYNLSFERLFGKIIAYQDMMASITSERSQRSINYATHSILRLAFLPI
ncbi:hypothetical protein [Pseudomonas sp. M30-35]|uniref:hypothetical protein n=1 Tax=Pseudomonas sp. M30-35 TaxID=1981174 RepID=UPI000B3CF719|nr:hypothetical protein [Pseudomonas sp. M30-35]ARU86918.1 hypothetical protein B9K09_02450 [Pseudomonas sp. M30-35]